MKKLIIFLFCFVALSVLGQTEEYLKFNQLDYPSKKYTIKKDTFNFHQVSIVLIQVKLKNDKDFDSHSAFCRIWMIVKMRERITKEIFYNDCEALGGCSGIFVSSKQPIGDYFILSKFGDYNGRIILVDSLGGVLSYPGGEYYLTDDNRYLFSIYNSDVGGLTVFDLKKRKLLYSADTLSTYFGFFYSNANRYFFKVETVEELDGELLISTYNFKLNRLENSKVKKDYLSKSKKIEGYNIFRLGPCYCGRKQGDN